jgi:4-amino-4-deoxy-L-arabinose transferase-like glycosyltransferase
LENKARRFLPWGILLLILTLGAVLRLQHLRADPPRYLVHLTNSAGIYFDEAMYCHNARNKILFGEWMLDDWNPILYNAALTGIYYAAFKLFGITIVAAKVTNILFGLLGVLFLYLAVRRYLSEGCALALTFLFGIDFYWLMYNRIGLLENFSTLFFILSFTFLVRAKEKPWNLVLVGVCVGMAVLSKYLFFYFFFSAGLAVLYYAWSERRWTHLARFLAGFFTVLAAWFFVVFLPLASSFRKIGSGWMDLSWPETIGKIFFNIYRNNLPRYMSLMPALFVVGLLFLAMVITRLWKKNPRPDVREMFVFLWLGGTFFQMAILNYQPLRYYLNFDPALFLAASLTVRNREWLRNHAGQAAWLFLPLAGGFYKFWIGLVKFPSGFLAFNYRAVCYLVYPALILIFMLWLGPLRRRLEAAGKIYIAVAIALSSLTVYYRNFYAKPVYQLETISSSLRQLPEGSVIMGNEAPRLALETRFRFFPAFQGWFNDEDPFRRLRPTHLLVLDKYWGGELVWIRHGFQEIASRLELIHKYPLWDSTVTLYKINYPPGY